MTTEQTFCWTEENEKKAAVHIAKYPEGRQQSAVMPLLDLAQRQNGGYLDDEIIAYIADYLDMAPIRVEEVATFYSMYKHKPVGKHQIRVCGTTPCWLRGADDIMQACMSKLGIGLNEVTKDGLFSLEEIECAGACVNAPVVSIDDDYYEDLDPKAIENIIDALRKGETPKAGPQIDRQTSAPSSGLTSLTDTVKEEG